MSNLLAIAFEYATTDPLLLTGVGALVVTGSLLTLIPLLGMAVSDHDSDFDFSDGEPSDHSSRYDSQYSFAQDDDGEDDDFELPPISKDDIVPGEQSKSPQGSNEMLSHPHVSNPGARNTVQDPIWVEVQRQIVEERQRNSELRDLFDIERRERERLAEQLEQVAEEKRVLLISLGEQKQLLQDTLEKNANLKEKLTKASYAAIDAQQLQHDLDEQREQLTAEINRLRSALDAANKKEKILISESARTASLEHALAVLGDELEALAAELTTAQSELALARKEPETDNSLAQENQSLKTQIGELQSELERLRKSFADSELASENSSQHLQTLRQEWDQERSQLESDLAAARDTNQALNQRNEELAGQNAELAERNSELSDRVRELEQTLAEAALDKAGQQELNLARETIDSLQKELSQVKADLEQHRTDAAELAQLRRQLETEYDKRARLVEKLHATRKSRDGLRRDARSSTVYKMELERQVETLKIEIDALRERVSADETPVLQARVGQLENELKQLRAELKIAVEENQRLTAAHSEWVQRYETQASELQERDDSLMKLARKLEEKEQLGRQMREMILAQKNAIEESHRDMRQLSIKYRTAMSKLAKLRGHDEDSTEDHAANSPTAPNSGPAIEPANGTSGSSERFRDA